VSEGGELWDMKEDQLSRRKIRRAPYKVKKEDPRKGNAKEVLGGRRPPRVKHEVAAKILVGFYSGALIGQWETEWDRGGMAKTSFNDPYGGHTGGFSDALKRVVI